VLETEAAFFLFCRRTKRSKNRLRSPIFSPLNRSDFLYLLAATIPGYASLKPAMATAGHSHRSRTMRYLHNPKLPILKPDWPGNPVNTDGTFENHEYPFQPEFSKLLKWQTSANPEKAKKKSERFFLKAQPATEFLNSTRDGLIWLGHASFLIRLNGKLLLTDPALFEIPFVGKRFAELPLNGENFPEFDYLLMSHDHRDHLDERSLKAISKTNPHPVVFTGLQLSPTIIEFIPGADTFEAGWYQPFPAEGVEVIYLPARHWSRRGLLDTKRTLWGAFLIRSEHFSIYFGADSGYGSHFAEVAELFGPPDIAILGIGAYKPEWFMHSSHTSPGDALKAALDMQAKTMIPMHYGTYDLSDEPLSDPAETLQKAHAAANTAMQLRIPAPGEPVWF
jgi:L-ascorbate metabolism protein UlaG (beta-lactamase superfamily)